MHRRTIAGLSIAVGFVFAFLGVVAFRAWHETERASGGSLPGLFNPRAPLGPDGQQVDLETAIGLSPIPLYRPDTTATSDASLAGVWLRTKWLPEVFMRYENGVEVSVRRADFSEGFHAFYEEEIAQGYPGRLLAIAGVELFVTPGNSGLGASGDLVIDGFHVQIMGAGGQTEDEVVSIAASIIERWGGQEDGAPG